MKDAFEFLAAGKGCITSITGRLVWNADLPLGHEVEAVDGNVYRNMQGSEGRVLWRKLIVPKLIQNKLIQQQKTGKAAKAKAANETAASPQGTETAVAAVAAPLQGPIVGDVGDVSPSEFAEAQARCMEAKRLDVEVAKVVEMVKTCITGTTMELRYIVDRHFESSCDIFGNTHGLIKFAVQAFNAAMARQREDEDSVEPVKIEVRDAMQAMVCHLRKTANMYPGAVWSKFKNMHTFLRFAFDEAMKRISKDTILQLFAHRPPVTTTPPPMTAAIADRPPRKRPKRIVPVAVAPLSY